MTGTTRPESCLLKPFVAIAGCILALAGCGVVRPVALSAQNTAISFRARSLDDTGLKAAATQRETGFAKWPPRHLNAHALDLAAIYFNPDLQVARDKWHAASAAIVTADQIPNPTFNVAPYDVASAGAGVLPLFLTSSLVQIVETAGKRKYRLARAQYLAEAARLDVLSVAWDTTSKVNTALVELAAAQTRATAVGRQVAVQSELVDVTEKLIQAGFGSRLELLTARTALNRAVLDQQTAQTALIDAQHQLAQAVGMPFDAIPMDRLTLPSLNQTLPPGFAARIREAAPLTRADLLAKLAEYAASFVTLQLEVANRIPNIEFGPAFEYDRGAKFWGVSLTAQLPMFNQNEGPIAEAAAQPRQAADQFTAFQAAVIGEVDRATAAYDSAQRSLAAAERLFAQQNQQVRTQTALFSRGESDRLEFLAAQVELATAALARVDAQSAAAKARLALEQAGHVSVDSFDPAAFGMMERKYP